ncbi:glycosyltransferase family 4 protein [Chryseobacterium suipulveris]|uniref:Glycosyltransferase family 4 protein n=1 Tax=Chryseobacterium suipulveris TaxID=2929800 RepID=A0ABY4BS00_9FLAO|nr:glycosyltransferase family 4 protein [Chryseobacterium suipulveris]UOE41549.1 glycosyltransferase family 4 protein [Chryseobacterium suipulveris]
MKLLYCIPTLETSGGTERIVVEKINYLIDNGYEIIIITTEGKSRKSFFNLNAKATVIPLNINFNEVLNEILPLKLLKTKSKLRLYKQQLKQLIDRESIDIVISTGAKELEFLGKLDISAKKVCELHFSKNFRKQAYISRSANIFWNLIGELRTRELINQTKNLDKLVVLTKEDESEWKESNENITQIYNFSAFESEEVSNLNTKTVIAVGRLAEQKGFDLLIDAWSLVVAENNDWILRILGTGHLENQLKEQAKRLGIFDSIVFEGQTDFVAEKILQSAIFALSSRYEGFPLVLLESITCGVPIVSFDCKTGPSEIITANDCGILVQDGNIHEFAKSLIKVMNDEELRKKMGEKAKEKSRFFSKKFIMNQWTALFDELMKVKK